MITAKDEEYQSSKPYTFKDLELSLTVKRNEVKILQKALKKETRANAGLRLDIRRLTEAHAPLDRRT